MQNVGGNCFGCYGTEGTEGTGAVGFKESGNKNKLGRLGMSLGGIEECEKESWEAEKGAAGEGGSGDLTWKLGGAKEKELCVGVDEKGGVWKFGAVFAR